MSDVRNGAAVRVEQQGFICTVTLDNPGKLNAMARSMWRDLRRVFLQIQQDAQIRCVLLRGADGNFCAGGDIAEYPTFRFDQVELEKFHEEEVWGGLSAMLACDVPIVAALEGACMGAGVEIASCCDLRWSGAGVRFGAPIARLGFPMAPREAALVARSVGASTARAMLLAAEIFSASQLLAQGFLTQVLDDADVWGASQALAQRIASLAPQAARANKQVLRALHEGVPVDNAYAFAASAEHREGIMAFLEKRKPNF
jgi:enoyl-CoA hydratase/carnithine racemase